MPVSEFLVMRAEACASLTRFHRLALVNAVEANNTAERLQPQQV